VKTARNHSEVDMIILFDHEEVGSKSAQGADSNMANEILTRISECLGAKTSEDHFRTVRNSLLLSADMVHAVHPNFIGKHQSQHMPVFHQGIVIKYHVNQNYATDSVSSAVLKVIADRCDVPMQEFMVR